MTYTKIALAMVCGLALGGCATLESTVAPTKEYKAVLDGREQAISALSQAEPCCHDLTSLPYKVLSVGDHIVPIDGASAAYQFEEGKSYVAAFRLPANSGDLRITVEGVIEKSMFNPTVMMLDSRFKVTRKLGKDVFKYEPARMLKGDRVEAVFTVDRSYVGNPNNETYMIIYTDPKGLDETTTIMSQAKLMAKSLSVVDYGVKDPVIPHSPWGVVNLSVEDLSGNKTDSNYYKPVYQDAIDANAPVVNESPNKLVVPLAASASKPAMLGETDAFYRTQIGNAVKAGDIEKAMKLVDEAERAGSTSARKTFVDAVRQSQK
ncbi:maltose operon periplasmic protein [Aeromonas diversa CDC 2478-85]|uniref:Maltose operon periplasmic protein n=1 Tax=Aeromonas diversa CDC 2478-85 TaxID=1268237 RepID=N9VMB2_9GAMM|nr:MalM family protein [Aeromonas diversa]ENY72511.1 maltose operon periplasmic protein [Aeromonas diversa CDC 2478-85]